jgi:ribosomal protein S18 acetylase RimI-like enzyme
MTSPAQRHRQHRPQLFSARRSRSGPLRALVRPDHPHQAVVAPLPGTPTTCRRIHETLGNLRARGITEVFTSALTPPEQEPFLASGFRIHEQLHLLHRSLDRLPDASGETTPGVRLRRGLWRDYPGALKVDTLAFEEFWRFDRASLLDARAATPTNRFRVADRRGAPTDSDRPHGVVGYAITGRAGPTCYLQRLAVHPGLHRCGVGTALVLDALRWAVARGAREALVNTQQHNAGALGLYRSLGFTGQPGGLGVLRFGVDT